MNILSGKISISIFSILLTIFMIAASDVSAATSPSLGTANGFAILGATAVTDVPPSVIKGDVGLSPAAGTGITGLTCAEVTGTIDVTSPGGSNINSCAVINPALLTTAQADSTAAFGALSAVPNAVCDVDYGAISKDLVGLTLVPGVYCANDFTLSGTLTLNDTGNATGVWIFRTASSGTLITSAGGAAKVQFLSGIGSPCNVWWKVVSSATLGTNTSFIGNILALTSIDLDTGATLNGRVLAQTGAVTLHMNNIDASTCVASANATSKPLIISKTFNTSTAQPGDIVKVTLNVTNNGTATLNTVKVIDVLPNQLTFDDSASPVQSSNTAQTVTWDNVGPLSSGSSTLITFLAQVNSNASVGTVGNFANVTGSPSEGNSVSTFTTTNLKIQAVIATPTAAGPWPYFLVITFGVIAAWSLSPTFVKFLSLNSRSLKRDFNGIKKRI
jgi:uncharacterized repeat protein (TIGR01451 family)